MSISIPSSYHASVIQTARAVDTDWFSSDISPSSVGARSNTMSKHTLMIHAPTADTVVNVQYKIGGVTVVMDLNSGTALVAGSVYVFDILVPDGATYNVQHKTTTQAITIIVAETKTGMIG